MFHFSVSKVQKKKRDKFRFVFYDRFQGIRFKVQVVKSIIIFEFKLV